MEEYYVYDIERRVLSGWQRSGGELEEIAEMVGWVSPRLEVTFGLEDGELVLRAPDGSRFASYVELVRMREEEGRRAEQERLQAEQERGRAEQEHQRAERLVVQLKRLGIDPEE